jgi:CBS domain-containing protein
MKVKDVMTAGEVKTVNPDDSIAYATELMLTAKVHHLPVVRGPHVVGLLSERDILRRGRELGGTLCAAPDLVGNAMSQPAATVGPDEPIGAALALMLEGHLGSIPVVGPSGPIGMVTVTDILRTELDRARAHSRR